MSVRVFLKGGLGNQLFQYAAAYSISQTISTELKLDCSLLPRAQDNFQGLSRWPEQISSFCHEGSLEKSSFQPLGRTSLRSKIISLRALWMSKLPASQQLRCNFVTDDNVMDLMAILNRGAHQRYKKTDLTMFGYFQNEELFAEHLDKICGQISNIQKPSPAYLRSKSLISRDSVAVHVRLGDKSRLSAVYTENLFQRLILKLSQLGEKSSKLMVYTDSAELFASKKLSNTLQLEFVDTQKCSPIETLNLIASANTIVGSESTFFWWASKLQKHFNHDAAIITY